MERGRTAHREWEARIASADGEAKKLWDELYNPKPVVLEGPAYEPGKAVATRNVNKDLFPEIADKVPGFIGGAADLVESTKTEIDVARPFSATNRAGRDIKFGVREHAMGTVTNGIAVHGGLRPYGATFFVFSDYMRPAVRLSALMNAPSIWVWTHDSVFLGEDGPTHQPIEHLASLRAMPNLWVIRPADATETVEAWEVALNRGGTVPVAIVQTRQNVPVLDRQRGGVAGEATSSGTVTTSFWSPPAARSTSPSRRPISWPTAGSLLEWSASLAGSSSSPRTRNIAQRSSGRGSPEFRSKRPPPSDGSGSSAQTD
jgi:transketolase (EC 2.2.1.1)